MQLVWLARLEGTLRQPGQLRDPKSTYIHPLKWIIRVVFTTQALAYELYIFCQHGGTDRCPRRSE